MTKPEVKPIRGQILQAAMDATLGSRNKSYGAPTPNLQLANELIAAVHPFLKNKYSPAHNQAIYLALHKLARIACGAKNHTDNYVDAAAYFAIAAECEDEASKIEAARGNYYTTGSDLAEEFWKEGNGFKDSLQSVIAGDTEEMLDAIARQNQEASQSDIEPSDRYDHYGESIKPNIGEWRKVGEDGFLPVLEVGMIFRSKKLEGDWQIAIYRGGEVLQAVKHPASKVVGAIAEMYVFHKNSITEVLVMPHTLKQNNNLRCLHCPSDAAPNKDVCIKCAMELGQ